MARELSIDVELAGAVEADAAIARLALAFQKAGDSALVAAEKTEKFEKAYKEGQARKQAATELNALAAASGKAGAAATTAAQQVTAKNSAITALTSTVLRFVAPAVMGAAIKSTLDWAGNLSDLSRSTGISTTALQKFEILGRSSGVTMQQIATTAIQMSDRLAGGDKSAATALKRVGLSASQLVAMSPDRALLDVAKAASEIINPMDRVAFLTDAVGKAGARTLLPMLDDLVGQWDSVAGVVNEKGIVSLDKAGDALSALAGVGRQFLADVLTPLAPAFTFLATSIGGFVQSTIPALQSWFNGVIEGFMRVEVAFRQFDDNMRNAGLRELDRMDPARAAAHRQMQGLPAGGFYNDAQQARDRLASFQFQPVAPIAAASAWPTGGLMAPEVKPKKGAAGGARILPFRQSTFALGSTAASIFALANTPGAFNAGSLPFLSSMGFLQAGGSPISFGNGSGFAPTVAMNAPGAAGGGGLGGWLGGHKTQLAALGLGLASRFIPQGSKLGGMLNLAGQGASMGAMFGPWGMAIGGGLGAIAGLFGGGKAKAEKNARSAETMQVFEQFSSKGFLDLQKQAEKFGISMDKALAAKNMKDFGAAVDEVTAKLQEMNDRQEEIAGVQSEIATLTAQSTVTFDQMDRVAKEFGLDINKLGPAFKQAAIDKEAQRIIDAFAIMERGGADVNGVLSGMGDEIGQLVSDSISMGTTIPSNMRPWIEKLHESGQLVDENGQKIRDISTIRYGDPMKSEMQKVVDKLDELITKLGTLTASFTTAKNAANDLANVDYTAPEWSNPGGDAVGMDSGGVAGRDFRRPSYRDVFPALLRRGERVLPPGATGAGVSLSIGNLTVGGGYGSRADAVEDIGDAVVAYLERRGARLVA